MLRALALLLLATSASAATLAPHDTLSFNAARETMQVRICIDRAMASVAFVADASAPDAIEDLRRTGGGPVERKREGWTASDWRAGECLAYRAMLGRLADAGRRSGGIRHGRDLIVDPSLWLLGVASAPSATADVELPPGYSISAPWHPVATKDRRRSYRIPSTPPSWMARVAIGPFAEAPMPVAGGALRVSILDGADAGERTRIIEWLRHVSRAAVSATGRLPLDDVQVLIVPVGHGEEPVVFGQSTRGQGHGLTLFVDPSRPVAEFDRDWVAVHELSHLFHPYLGDRGAWLAEGLATYDQNVLRARAGMLSAAEAWRQIDAGFDRGRSGTASSASTLEDASSSMGRRHDFMRVYWSGTAYWLAVDLALRRESRGRVTLDDAIGRFDACCLPSTEAWTPERFVARLDALVGSSVFVSTYDRFRVLRAFPDTKALFAALGIEKDGDTMRFSDNDAAASLRESIMAPRKDGGPRPTL